MGKGSLPDPKKKKGVGGVFITKLKAPRERYTIKLPEGLKSDQ